MTPHRRHAIRQAHPRRELRGRRYLPAVAGVVLLTTVTLFGYTLLAGPSGVASSSARSSGNGPTSSPIAGASSITAPSVAAPPPSGATAVPEPSPALTVNPAQAGRFGLGLLIADRGNGRLLIVNEAHQVLWRFPGPNSLPAGQKFSADDAFLAPDGRTIVANDEMHEVIDRIDIVTRRVIWQYGHYGHAGSAPGYLHTPDDAYPLANGDLTVADIRNCRVLEIDKAKRIVRRWGRTGDCRHRPPLSYDNPNGDTPLPDGGMLITEIGGSRVDRLDATGKVVFDLHVPVAYSSDAQLTRSGDVLIVDYSDPGAVLMLSPRGKVLWRYGPKTGDGRLNHPSLAISLPDGTIAVNDDFRSRVVVIDPRTNRIVWRYGHTGIGGKAPGYLFIPDGMDLIPIGTRLR